MSHRFTLQYLQHKKPPQQSETVYILEKMTPHTAEQRFPVIDIGRCSICQGCASIAPEIFFLDDTMGKMSVTHLESYPETLIEEAIKNCPKDCIYWDIPL